MRITINDKEVNIPSSLSEITLGQRIDFNNQYGQELDEMARSVLDMPDGMDKDMEVAQFAFEKMFRTFAFFANTTPEALKESEFVDDIARIYYATLAVVMQDEAEVELKTSFVWDSEEWELHPPTLKHGSRMKFGEFIDSKQLIKDMIELGNGKWEYMLPICAIYLRKKGEEYREEFLFEGSERMELMRSLPMDIAMAVGFFLSSSMNLFVNTLLSSSLPGLNPLASTALNTTTVGAGSTS